MTVDDLRVPGGAACDLQGTTIKGQLKVETGATLRASALRLTGNLQGEGASRIALSDSVVGANAVTGDVQLFENRGAITVSRNRIDGNLQCKENAPGPTGGGNVVRGNAEDQCAARGGGDAAQAAPGGSSPPATSSRLGVRRGARSVRLAVSCACSCARPA